MKHIMSFALALVLAAPAAGRAQAASSESFHTDGATIRLITTGLADRDGVLRGALEVDLDPGWKTYWRDPGASGVPPQITLDGSLNVEDARLGYPAPQWHEDSYGAWAGYDAPVRFPVIFTIGAPERYALIEANVFVGVCQNVCIPVQARLTVEPGSAPDAPADKAAVEAAFAALPAPAGDDFGVTAVRLEADQLIVEAAMPAESGEAALFVAGAQGYLFGTPRTDRTEAGNGPADRTIFHVPILQRPGTDTPPPTVAYTLVTDAGAVAGEISLP
ncbi:MAG: protein-disulfide reductase DsbD domain-containing protein [Nitratireductor sp.]